MRLYTNRFGGLFLWIFIGTTLAISYHSYIFYQSDSLEKHISEVIENEINAVKSHITKSNASTLTADIEFTFLNVEIYRQDSIVFWHRKMPNGHSSKSKKIETFVYQNDSILLFLDIFNPNGQLNPILANRLDLPFDIILTQDKSKYTFQFYGQTYTYAKKPFTLWSGLITLWWLMLYGLVFTLCGTWMARNRKSMWVTISSIFCLAAVLWMIQTYTPLSYLQKMTMWDISMSIFDKTTITFYDIALVLSGLTCILLTMPRHGRVSSTQTFSLFQDTCLAAFLTTLALGGLRFMVFVILPTPEIAWKADNLLNLDFLGFSFLILLLWGALLVYSFSFYLFSQSKTTSPPKRRIYQSLALPLGWILGIVILYSIGLKEHIMSMALFALAYALIMEAYTERQSYKITYMLWWMIIFSAYLAVNIFDISLKKDMAERRFFSENYFGKPHTEAIKQLSSVQDKIVQSNLFNILSTTEIPALLDLSDIENYLSIILHQNLNEFQYSVELFDRLGNTLLKNHYANYFKTKQTYIQSQEIAPGIFYNPIEKLYVFKFEIANSQSLDNSITIYLHFKPLSPSTPAVKNIENQVYAVFDYNDIIEKNGLLGAETSVSAPYMIQRDTIMNRVSHIVYKFDNRFKIISYKPLSGFIKPISLFSFLFVLCGIIVGLLTIANTRLRFLPYYMPLHISGINTLKSRIQLSIIILVITSFVIIGAFTLYYINNLIKAQSTSRFNEDITVLKNSIISDIQNMPDTEQALSFMNSKVKEYALVHDKDIILYNTQGLPINTSNYDYLNDRLDYKMWLTLRNDAQWQNTKVIDAPNKEAYLPIVSGKNQPIAILRIVTRSSQDVAIAVLEFVSTILNAYIFLFLIAGAIALAMANSITLPLSKLTEKLKAFKLGRQNEPLEWHTKDEIGTLIDNYNTMTKELQKSADVLAQTEREMAWREMAKQVAHEIKNPLTPMKLSIQYLQKTSNESSEKALELIPRITNTLIEQINNLSQIAGEFSNFATLPQANNEKIILNEVVETIHDLFRKRDDMDIKMIEPIDELYVFADKNHLVRVLNNLIKNAIQSIPEGRKGEIIISIYREDNDAIVSVKDNGIGIPDDMKKKVFTPNFTTKSSGTGLGLAIASNMMESCNGKIYFESTHGEGTTFFIRIPLMRYDDNYSPFEQNVSLD